MSWLMSSFPRKFRDVPWLWFCLEAKRPISLVKLHILDFLQYHFIKVDVGWLLVPGPLFLAPRQPWVEKTGLNLCQQSPTARHDPVRL